MTQLLPFNAGETLYALQLTDIQEIVEHAQIYPFPAAAEIIAGAIGFHGRVVPVVNLLQLLGCHSGQTGARLIVLINSYGPLAFAVGQIRPIITLAGKNCQVIEADSDDRYISKLYNWQGEMISLLDLNSISAILTGICAK